jgi:F-type H+-transporting ATPase subunit b
MRLRRIAILAAPIALALALIVAGPGAPLRAQEPAAAEGTAPAAHAPAEGEAAAHEGPEGAEGHAHHPEVKLFGHSLGRGAQFGVQLFNFVLFAGILVALLKGALSSAFSARAKDLEERLSAAEREKAEADRQIRELEARMAGLQEELAGIMAKAETDAEAEQARIIDSAKAEAAQIIAQTRAEIESQQRQAEAELRALLAELVVAGATSRLQARVQGDVAGQVMEKAIEQVGGRP